MDFDYFNFKSNNKVAKGSLIFSQPLMQDLNFNRSIILICEHNSEGSFGYKLNDKIKPNSIQKDINPIIKNRLFSGGPVDTSYLNFIHNSQDIEDSEKISENVYLGGELESILDNKLDYKIDIKFFSGYSGWSQNQLETEIEDNSWIVVNEYDYSIIFKEIDDNFWSKFLSNQGIKNKIFSNYPKDSSMN